MSSITRTATSTGARRAFKVVPPHVEYTLTPMGEEAAELVAGLADWIEVNLGKMRAPR